MSEPHIVSEPYNSIEAEVEWLRQNNFSGRSADIQYQRGTVSYEALRRYNEILCKQVELAEETVSEVIAEEQDS